MNRMALGALAEFLVDRSLYKNHNTWLSLNVNLIYISGRADQSGGETLPLLRPGQDEQDSGHGAEHQEKEDARPGS